jgi:DNA polymerase-3 subunit delta'
MFGNLLFHDAVVDLMNSLAANPPQGLLLVGPEGIGKLSMAQALAERIVDHPTGISVISPDEKGTIAIETIRELYKTTRAKQKGRQVVIVERADRMSMEAENAFLKLLEEPRSGLTFVLTAPQLEALLPTVLSRVQHVALQPLPDDVIRRFIVSKKPGIAQNDLSQLVFLAQGRPGIATMLLIDGTLSKHRERMQLVKQLISAKLYDRFVIAGKLSSSRDETIETLTAMSRVIEVQLSSATSPAQARHWAMLADTLEATLQTITHNGNVRAQLLYLFSRY